MRTLEAVVLTPLPWKVFNIQPHFAPPCHGRDSPKYNVEFRVVLLPKKFHI